VCTIARRLQANQGFILAARSERGSQTRFGSNRVRGKVRWCGLTGMGSVRSLRRSYPIPGTPTAWSWSTAAGSGLFRDVAQGWECGTRGLPQPLPTRCIRLA
jgi:hypothetical protein